MINRKINLDKSRLKEIIKKASAKFIEGNVANEKVDDEKMEEGRTGYLAIRNNSFVRLSTSIPGTNFIATAGPIIRNDLEARIKKINPYDDVEKFYDDILSNNIEEVVGLCRYTTCAAYNDGSDFFNYFLFEEGHPHFLRYQVKTELLSEKFPRSFSSNFSSRYPLAKSQVTLTKENDKTEKKINVTVFFAHDRGPIYSDEEATLEQLWQLFKKSQSQPILVHCHAGVGRTGHFILILEILKNYDAIFSEENTEASADKIIALLHSMRSVRPGLVSSKEQFEFAIYYAYKVYEYALAKKYLAENSLTSEEKSTTAQIATGLKIAPMVQPPLETQIAKKNEENEPLPVPVGVLMLKHQPIEESTPSLQPK